MLRPSSLTPGALCCRQFASALSELAGSVGLPATSALMQHASMGSALAAQQQVALQQRRLAASKPRSNSASEQARILVQLRCLHCIPALMQVRLGSALAAQQRMALQQRQMATSNASSTSSSRQTGTPCA